MQNFQIINNSNYIVAFCPIVIQENEFEILSSKIKPPNFKSIKRKNEWFTIHLLLEKIFNLTTTYCYNKLNKPVLLNKSENISISHSNKYVSIILSKNKKVGIDVEEITPRIHKISHKFLNKSEKKYIELAENKTEMLYVIWCAKEAIYKYSDLYLDFPSQIIVKKFNLNDTIIKAEIIYDKKIKAVELQVYKQANSVFVWLAE